MTEVRREDLTEEATEGEYQVIAGDRTEVLRPEAEKVGPDQEALGSVQDVRQPAWLPNALHPGDSSDESRRVADLVGHLVPVIVLRRNVATEG
jgi:hypothetical protein